MPRRPRRPRRRGDPLTFNPSLWMLRAYENQPSFEPEGELRPEIPPEDRYPHCRPINPDQQPPPKPTNPRHKEKDLSRDDRVGLKKMSEWTGWKTAEITAIVPFTARQVQYALERPPTPQKTNPRPGGILLKPEELKTLDDFLNEDRSHREISYQDRVGLPWLLSPPTRKEASHKPRIRTARVQMSEAILNRWPDIEDWRQGNIIFTDEKTFYTVNKGAYGLTIRHNESIRNYRHRRQHGNTANFWGSICGRHQGPGFIFPVGVNNNALSYGYGPLYLLNGFLEHLRSLGRLNVEVMQDNLSIHKASFIKDLIQAWGINLMDWAAWSPDLNPIENVWSYMEVWIDDNFNIEDLTRVREERAIIAAWVAVPVDYLEKLILAARERFMKCILMEGWPLDN